MLDGFVSIREEKQSLERLLEGAESKCEQITADLEATSMELQKSRVECDTAKEDLASMVLKVRELKHHKALLEADITAEKLTAEGLRAEVEQMRRDQSSQPVFELQQELDSTNDRFQTIVQELREELADAKAQIQRNGQSKNGDVGSNVTTTSVETAVVGCQTMHITEHVEPFSQASGATGVDLSEYLSFQTESAEENDANDTRVDSTSFTQPHIHTDVINTSGPDKASQNDLDVPELGIQQQLELEMDVSVAPGSDSGGQHHALAAFVDGLQRAHAAAERQLAIAQEDLIATEEALASLRNQVRDVVFGDLSS